MNEKTINHLLNGANKNWTEEVSDNFEVGENYLSRWLGEYRRGIHTKEDIIKVAEKIAQHRNDGILVDRVKTML